MVGWVIACVVVAGLGIAGRVGWSNLSKEHREAAGVALDGVDFNRLADGVYHGSYAGGMYKWRANECQVTVDAGKVTGIQLIDGKEKNMQPQALYDRVIAAQSLQVDTISGATLTSNAYLKGVENALVQARK